MLSATKDSLIVRQGEEADRFFHLQQGEIALLKSGQDGTDVEISRIRPGQWFGEVVLFAAGLYPANARALKDSEISVYRCADLVSLMESDPQVSAFFLHLLAGKCLALTKRLEELTVMPVRERFIRYLYRLCGSSGRACPLNGPCKFELPAKKRVIAAELGIVPETLSRAIKALEEEGLISVNAASVTVMDCGRLRSEL